MANLDDAINAFDKRITDQGPTLDQSIELLGKRLDKPTPGPVTSIPSPGSPAGGQPQPPAGLTRGAPEGPNDPAQMYGPPPAEPQSIGSKMVGRLFGTDVEDPIPLTRMGTTITGAVAGGLAGLRTPGPPIVKGAAAAIGSTVGTAAGAVAPEMTMEALEYVGAIEEGARNKYGLSPENLRTVVEGEVLLDVATGGGITALRATSRGISNLMTGANRASRELAETATREGIAMLPVQVGERTFARGFVSVMGRFPWVAGGLKKRAQTSMDQIQRAFQGVPERFGPLTTFDEASARILRDARHTTRAISEGFQQRYNALLGQAAARRITVRPTNTRAVTDRLMSDIAREVPRGVGGVPGRLPKATTDLRRFIQQNTRILYEGTQIADLPMRQMDTILNNIDTFMTTAAKSGDAKTLGRIEQLRQAIQLDMVGNASGPAGSNADQLVSEMHRLDVELTQTVDALFNNATSRRLGISISANNRSARFGGLGTKGADSLAKVLLRDGGPEIVDELARITSPQTMRQLTGAVFDSAVQKSFTHEPGNAIRFDVDAFARNLGLDSASSATFRQTERLMMHSGGLSMNDLQQLVEVARRASRAEIPDVSTFIARRATIGGISTAVKTLAPWALLSGAGAGGGLWGGIIAIGGSKLLSNIISDPRSARALSRVVREEGRTVIKRKAAIRAVAFGVNNMMTAGEITRDTANAIMETFDQYSAEVQRIAEEQLGSDK